jgi:uncharacterized membrane protein
MPFCNQCGSEVRSGDPFCGNCGKAQTFSRPASSPGANDGAAFRPATAPNPTIDANDPLASLSPQVVATLCYTPFLGWIMSIIVLASSRFRLDQLIRFHAFQGLYLAVAYLIYDWVVEGILYYSIQRFYVISRLVKLAYIGGSIFLMVKTNSGEAIRVPVISEIADRSVAEQR